MVNQYQKRVLIMALYAGEIMMKSGAEIYRVEDTIVRICKACKIPYVECFATTTGIFLSLDGGDSEGDMFTFIKRIYKTKINLAKISRINEFSRLFTTTDLSVTDGLKELRLIEAATPYPMYLRVLAAAIVGASMLTFFGGSPLDMILTAVFSSIGYFISEMIDKFRFIDFIRVFLGSSICALLAILSYASGITATTGPLIVGSIVIFLPGVPITNAARDMLAGDMLSGTARFIEAVLIAIGIAGGVGMIMPIANIMNLNLPMSSYYSYPIWLLAIFGTIATGGIAIIFNVLKKHLLTAALIGGAGTLIRNLYLLYDDNGLIACFFGACMVAFLSEFASRAGKDATTMFIIPAILPLVPGMALYSAMQGVIYQDLASAGSYGIHALLYAGAIAVALVIIAALTRLIVAVKNRIKNIFA